VLLFPDVITLATEMIESGTTLNFETDYPAEKVVALKRKLSGQFVQRFAIFLVWVISAAF
jgi:hypothetical protein